MPRVGDAETVELVLVVLLDEDTWDVDDVDCELDCDVDEGAAD